MRVKIRDDAPNSSVPSYLTKGKVYDVVDNIGDELFEILDNIGDIICVKTCGCEHLKGGAWDVLCDNKELDSLKRGLAEMKVWIEENKKHLPAEGYSWTDYEYVDADDALNEINRILGDVK